MENAAFEMFSIELLISVNGRLSICILYIGKALAGCGPGIEGNMNLYSINIQRHSMIIMNWGNGVLF